MAVHIYESYGHFILILTLNAAPKTPEKPERPISFETINKDQGTRNLIFPNKRVKPFLLRTLGGLLSPPGSRILLACFDRFGRYSGLYFNLPSEVYNICCGYASFCRLIPVLFVCHLRWLVCFRQVFIYMGTKSEKSVLVSSDISIERAVYF